MITRIDKHFASITAHYMFAIATLLCFVNIMPGVYSILLLLLAAVHM